MSDEERMVRFAEELWREYFDRAERFDRTVCTGRAARDGCALPETGEQFHSIHVHSSKLRAEIYQRAHMAGVGAGTMREAWWRVLNEGPVGVDVGVEACEVNDDRGKSSES